MPTRHTPTSGTSGNLCHTAKPQYRRNINWMPVKPLLWQHTRPHPTNYQLITAYESWQLNCTVPLAHSVMLFWYFANQSRPYPSCRHARKLSSDKHTFCKSLLWLDQEPKFLTFLIQEVGTQPIQPPFPVCNAKTEIVCLLVVVLCPSNMQGHIRMGTNLWQNRPIGRLDHTHHDPISHWINSSWYCTN